MPLTVLIAEAGGQHELTIDWEPYVIDLRTAFGTSHSSTTQRTNLLLRLRVADVTGVRVVVCPSSDGCRGR
jgi:hypothetical protein